MELQLFMLNRAHIKNEDEYKSSVVVAYSEQNAKRIHPSGLQHRWKEEWMKDGIREWAYNLEEITCIHIGRASSFIVDEGVILSS